jgi:predicted nucleic acid-binding protein
MTIDERLERLAERHESLTHFVELSAREYDRRAAEDKRRMTEIMEGLARALYTVQQDGENIRALARVAENHERRLTDLEGPTG